ncbi:hypothetical protein CHS0354_040972, partial [Potamilus streckersoni]
MIGEYKQLKSHRVDSDVTCLPWLVTREYQTTTSLKLSLLPSEVVNIQHKDVNNLSLYQHRIDLPGCSVGNKGTIISK